MKARNAGNCFTEISLPAFFPSSPAFFIEDTPDRSSAHRIHPHPATPSALQSRPTPAPPRSILAAYIAQSGARRRHDNPAPGSAAAHRAAPIAPLANYGPAPFPPPTRRPHDPCTSTPLKYFLRAPVAPANQRRSAPRAGSTYARPALRPHSDHVSGLMKSVATLTMSAMKPAPRVLPAGVCVPTWIRAAAARPGLLHLAAPPPAAVLHDALHRGANCPVPAPTPAHTLPTLPRK